MQCLIPALARDGLPTSTRLFNVMGIDPSLRGLAGTVLVPGEPAHEVWCTSKPAKGARRRLNRYWKLCSPVIALAKRYQPAHVFIEAPAFSRHMRGVRDMAEARIILILRLKLVLARSAVICDGVSPSALKKFSASYGAAGKTEVGEGLQLLYGRAFDPNDKTAHDKADAYGLAKLAQVVTGQSPPSTPEQREVVLDVIEMLKEAA